MQTEVILKSKQLTTNSAYLKAESNSGGQSWKIEKRSFIGRDCENEIVIADPFISRKHAKIEEKNGKYYLLDLDSQNGTYVNQTEVKEVLLNEGDKVYIGNRTFIFSRKKPSSNLYIESKNESYSKILSALPNLANTELAILLQGESGSGKEVVSKAIHYYSKRSSGPFISINCSALSANLIESELFGHKRGSFTDANSDRKGAFESARGGTLVLDEIGDLPLDLQPKLLRALENQEIRPLGCDKVVKTDIRLISSTHKDLKTMVAEGRFRADLYYRLNIINVEVPPLRERMEDFDELINSFCMEMRVKFNYEAMYVLKNYAWPGNIRELKNVVSRASAFYQGNEIGLDIVSKLIELSEKQNQSFRGVSLKVYEKNIIIDKLKETEGNQRKAAKLLGIPKSTLNDKVRRYQIDIKDLKFRVL